jgi:signal transduction histidine kinase/ligand-binding sensor domain-containing protein
MKYSLQIVLIVIILSCITISSAFAQQIIFSKITPPDGKTFDFVTGITQDDNGFMWYSTKKGLYSYDGNRITSYKNNPLNPNSLVSNLLESVFADTNGNIWVGCLGKGLELYHPETGIFTHFHHDPDDTGSLSNDTVTSILRDEQGNLWIGTHGGLDRFDPVTNKFMHFRHSEDDPNSLSSNQVRKIYEDKEGIVWIGTGSAYQSDGGGPEYGGLNRLNMQNGSFTRFKHDPDNPQSLINNKISAIFEDNQGVLWIGAASAGLHKMNRQAGTFERIIYDPAHPEKFSGLAIDKETVNYNHITFIIQDAAGSYWFGTSDEGLFSFNSHARKLTKYRAPGNSSSDYADYGAFTAFISRDHILWIGGTQGNIYHIDPLRKEIQHTLVSSAPVNSFYEEPDGTFWLGTAGELIKTGTDSSAEKSYTIDTNPANSGNIFVYIINGDRQGNIWVGTSGGLLLWDKKNEKSTWYNYELKDEYSLSNKDVISIYEDNEANLWIGTFRGLNLLDRETGTFTHYFMNPADNSTFGLNIVTSVFEDKTGKLWVASWNGAGIYQFDRQTKTFKNYLKGTSVITLYEDSDGVLWAGGQDGLYKFNRDIDNFIRYSDSGSPSGISDVLSIIEDRQKYLWIGTPDGIVRLNPGRDETSKYGKNHGIGENTLNFGAYCSRLNGEIYFGDAAGYYSFFPDELIQNLKTPEIVFTGFHLADQLVRPGDGGPLNERLSQLSEIRLRYDQKVFSIDFAVIDFADPEENKLIYFLENYENTWHQANSEQRAYYFNIPPGKYIFRVKAANSYGVWAEKQINIIIFPPWWGTWWAYMIYGLLLIAAVFAVDRIQRRRLLARERSRAREKELEQARAIAKAYNKLQTTQAQLIQSEKMASLGELTAGIAHEIQNPLNFVNNFSEVNLELIGELNGELDNGNLAAVKSLADTLTLNEQKINFHGKRADSIVKGMLQHSRTSNGQKELTDINQIADEYLRLSYHGLRAKDKSFNSEYKTEFDENLPRINVIPQDIGRVLLNLINNAFYAVNTKDLSGLTTLTGSNGFADSNLTAFKPTVTVSTKNVGSHVEIRVQDNGGGIPKNLMDRIFQPFFTTKPTGEGTGLGLSLSYDIVKAHGGELKVETKEGEGSTFFIQLPL